MTIMESEEMRQKYDRVWGEIMTALGAFEGKREEYATIISSPSFETLPLFFREKVAGDMAELDRRLMRMRLLRERLNVMARIIDDYKTTKR